MNDLSSSSSVLQQAYELIQDDDLAGARNILDDYLITHPNDDDGWWLYAHAVADPVEAQSALRTVLRLRPDYEGARELLGESEQLMTFTNEELPSAQGGIPQQFTDTNASPIRQTQPMTSTLDPVAAGSDTDRRPVFLIAAVLIAVLLIGLAVVLANQAALPSLDSTTVGVVTDTDRSDEVVTSEIEASATDVALTDTTAAVDMEEDTTAIIAAQDAQYGTLYAALSDFDVVENSAGMEDAAVGQTALVSICNNEELGLQRTSVDALTSIAAASDTLIDLEAEFVGVRVIDCQRENLVLRTLALPLSEATAFAEGQIDEVQLLSRLVPIS